MKKEEKSGVNTSSKKNILITATALLIILADQLTKFLVARNMQPNDSIPIITNALHLTYVQNEGAGFGMMQGYQILLIILSIALLGAIIYYYKRIPPTTSYSLITGMIVGGIIGNLIDRIALGYVVDFIDFRVWPVFNIADSCLTIAVAIMIVESLRIKK